MPKYLNIIIIGGGIGGLAAAVALQQRGHRVRVFERAQAYEPVGAGLWLWNNAVQALQALELFQAVAAAGVVGPASQIREWNGRTLAGSVVPPGSAAANTITILRSELQTVLLAALPNGVVQFGMPCTGVTQTRDSVTAHFAGGQTATGDLLVAADGIGSTIRTQLFAGGPMRYAGFSAWRAVVPFDPRHISPGVAWGYGSRFGVVPLRDMRVNWFAAINMAPGAARRVSDPHAFVVERFRGWHAPIPELLAATDPNAILCHDVYYHPALRSWVNGRVALLGDAAHAMTPSLGQGACQALEDAVVLARCLSATADSIKALLRYEQLRRPRATVIARLSRRMDQIAQLSSPLLCEIRNKVVYWTPDWLRARQLAWLFDMGFQTA